MITFIYVFIMQGANSARGQPRGGSIGGRHVRQNPQHPNAAVLLVEPLPGRVDVGTVKAIAALAGAQPIIDVGINQKFKCLISNYMPKIFILRQVAL